MNPGLSSNMVNPVTIPTPHSKFYSALTLILLLFLLGTCQKPQPIDEEIITADVVVYGGTSGAVTTAVQVARMGKSVIVVAPELHLGGLTASGLGYTDTGNKEVIGGLSREFYQRIYNYYQDAETWVWQKKQEYGNKGQGTVAIDGEFRTMWIFEPHIAEQVYEDMIEEHQIPVYRDHWLDRQQGVEMERGNIKSITCLNGAKFSAKVFVDATYEGDLMAAAGIEYHVGRESKATYKEDWNGVQTGVLHHGHHFGDMNISPYATPGDPTTGVLARISAEHPGNYGDGDQRIQAYCFRTCLTKVEENRVPFARPKGYDSTQYELMLRIFDAGWRDTFQKFDPIPNLKTDVNNHGPFSFDNIGMNYQYPEGTYEQRRQIIQEHVDYQTGLLYFLANDPRVPDEIRIEMSQWGLAKDEFTDNRNWPHQIYVREARRMIGEFVMTENEIMDRNPVTESIGMGSYTMDSHNVQRYITDEGYVQNEGDIGVKPPKPYQIALGSIRPKETQCKNLLVSVAVSSSHIAFGSIRMEPVFMILGQSAGVVAAMAIDQELPVQQVAYSEIRSTLLELGQILEYQKE
jgi:hypothetical protein